MEAETRLKDVETTNNFLYARQILDETSEKWVEKHTIDHIDKLLERLSIFRAKSGGQRVKLVELSLSLTSKALEKFSPRKSTIVSTNFKLYGIDFVTHPNLEKNQYHFILDNGKVIYYH